MIRPSTFYDMLIQNGTDFLFQALLLDNVSCKEENIYAEFISIYCVEGG